MEKERIEKKKREPDGCVRLFFCSINDFHVVFFLLFRVNQFITRIKQKIKNTPANCTVNKQRKTAGGLYEETYIISDVRIDS